jgi:hypothetical protein
LYYTISSSLLSSSGDFAQFKPLQFLQATWQLQPTFDFSIKSPSIVLQELVVVLLLLEEVNHHLTSTPNNAVVQEYCCQSKLEPLKMSNNVENTHKILY